MRRSFELAGVVAFVSLVSFAAARYSLAHGYTLLDGDAEAHLNIARRIVDSRTPGPEQIGTVWLPLPHLVMIPFVSVDAWWQNGMGGAFPSMLSFVAAGIFLFAAARRAAISGVAVLAVFALNPNLLY